MSASIHRRTLLLACLGAASGAGAAISDQPASALPEQAPQFPRDHGAHPDFRTEWWYLTGHAQADDRTFGFQLTFFRSRVEATQGMSSRFAARQLVFAHAALTDVRGMRLWHDQRIAREGFGIAGAATQDTRVHVRDWSLVRDDAGYEARMTSTEFALSLRCAVTQPVLLQGRQGLSRKGPDAAQASYYYSQPQLAVTGTVLLRGRPAAVTGTAWLDHEWSQALLHPEAVGWDWIGMNLDDGSALTAFRLRRADGSTLWDGGSFRPARADVRAFRQGEVTFTAQRRWTSPRSRASYPVEWGVATPAGTFTVKALIDDQELDSSPSTGAIYWEGLSELVASDGRRVGRGYLEMTGYARPLRM